MEFKNFYIKQVHKNRNYIAKKIFGNIGEYGLWGEIATLYRIPVDNYNEPLKYRINISYDEPMALFCNCTQNFIKDACEKLLNEPDCRGIL